MVLNNYHITNSFSSKFLELKVTVSSYIPAIIKKAIKLRNWKTGAIAAISRGIDEIYKESEIAKESALKFDIETAKLEYNTSLKFLRRAKKNYTRLEKVDFFGQPHIQVVSEKTLANFYFIEGHVRLLAFSETPTLKEDKNLSDIASAISLGSLQA